MITSLLVHEFRRTRGMLGVVVAGAAALSLAGTALMVPRWALAPLGLPLAVFAVTALLPVALLALAVDYWRSAYGRGGYLTQTLPIRGSRIFTARLVYGLVIVLVGLVVSVVLAIPPVLAAAHQQAPAGTGVFEYVSASAAEVASMLSPPGWLLLVGALVFGTWMYLVHYYFSATVGSQGRFASLGPAGPVLVWFLLYLVLQVAFFVSIVAIPLGLDVRAGQVALRPVDYWAILTSGGEADQMPIGFIPVVVIATAVLAWWTGRCWNRNLTLR